VSTSPIFYSHQNPGQKPFCNFKKRRKNCGEEEKETERKRFLYKVMLACHPCDNRFGKKTQQKGEGEREGERDTLGLTFGELWEHSEIPSCTIQVLHDCSTTRKE
jgi:hypothetical protein